MQKETQFLSIFKKEGEKTNPNQPDYDVTVSFKLDDGSYVSRNVGGGWIKYKKDNVPYISIKINDKPYTKQNGDVVPAYKVVEIEAPAPQPATQPQQHPQQQTVATEEVKIENVPF